MSTLEIKPKNFDEARDYLNSVALEFPSTEYIFRGHQSSQWRLCTTYERYWMGQPQLFPAHLERMIEQFRSGITRLGLGKPIGDDRLAWLEYARHFGLPAPLLDFSWSPFVALFFAFDGVRDRGDASQGSAVYCLNLDQLAQEIARQKANPIERPVEFEKARAKFLYAGAEPFEDDFPDDELLFIRDPSEHARRMHAQRGVFLYSTIDDDPGCDLESMFSGVKEGFDSHRVPADNQPVLTKIFLPHSWISEVFNYLDMVGITGSALYLSEEGVARDVFNAFNYTPRSAFLRNV